MGRIKGSKDGSYTLIKILCEFCHKYFEVYPARIRQGVKYCSRNCKNKSLIGKKHTLEHNQKIRIGHLGKKHSPESIQRMRIAQRNRSPMTEETREKISKAHSKPRKNGRCRTVEGYLLVWSPDHPNKNCNNYVLEHRLIMEKHIGHYLKSTEIVHHKNGIVDDNRIENLELFDDWKKHIAFHKSKILNIT